MDTPSVANSQAKKLQLPRWSYIAWGVLFCAQGVQNILSRHNIPFGVCQSVIGLVMFLSHLLKRRVGLGVNIALIVLFTASGIAELVTRHTIWGVVIFALALLFVFVLRDARRQRNRTS